VLIKITLRQVLGLELGLQLPWQNSALSECYCLKFTIFIASCCCD